MFIRAWRHSPTPRIGDSLDGSREAQRKALEAGLEDEASLEALAKKLERRKQEQK